MEEPTSSGRALAVNIFLTACNICSTVTYCLESIPINREDGLVVGTLWYKWEIGLMIIFTLELICRAPAHTTVRQFVFRRPEIFIDFLACVPFDLYLFFGIHLAILDTRWIRPVRLLRIAKFGNYILDLKLILTGLFRSMWMILLMWMLVILVLFSFASILFMVERGPWDSTLQCYVDQGLTCTAFESVPAALYFALEVTCSLGYGDMVPHTTIGRGLTMLLMLAAVCIIALTVTVFSVQFSQVYKGVKRDILVESLRESTDLTMRVATFDDESNNRVELTDAACRLVTSIEVLQAISSDLSETLKKVRAELVYLSEGRCKGAFWHNKALGRSKAFPCTVERALAELGNAAYNDIDTLTSFTLSTTEELFVKGVGGAG